MAEEVGSRILEDIRVGGWVGGWGLHLPHPGPRVFLWFFLVFGGFRFRYAVRVRVSRLLAIVRVRVRVRVSLDTL